MHCPHCGAESATGLKFCKRCGEGLIASAAPGSGRAITILALVFAVVGVVVAGLGITFGVAGHLAGNGIKAQDGPVEIGILGSLVVLVTAVLLIRLLWKIVMFDLEAQRASLSPVQSPKTASTTNDLDIPQLSPVVPSVTEHTTRSFEPQKRTRH